MRLSLRAFSSSERRGRGKQEERFQPVPSVLLLYIYISITLRIIRYRVVALIPFNERYTAGLDVETLHTVWHTIVPVASSGS